MFRRLEQTTCAAAKERSEWLESHLSGLIAAGLRFDEIEVQEHPGMVTRIAVRGVTKFEFRVFVNF